MAGKPRSLRTYQEVEANATRQYVAPVQIPVFSFHAATVGTESPSWVALYDVIITDIVLAGISSNPVGTGSSSISLCKRNDLLPDDDPVIIATMTLAASDKKSVLSLKNSYWVEREITPYDNLYVLLNAMNHTSLSIQPYGEKTRQDGL